MSDDEDDDDLWARAVKDIRPLSGGRGTAPFIPSFRSRMRRAREDFFDFTPAPLPSRGKATDLDRRTEERLTRGELPLEGRMDLHGMTQAQAHRALQIFIRRSFDDGKRCVLIITGKGVRTDDNGVVVPGVLRAAVPTWLGAEVQAGRVLRWTVAQPQHGGDGALYVLLRRQR